MSHPKIKCAFGLISAIVITVFGIYLLVGALKASETAAIQGTWTAGRAFLYCFALTLSSPLTLFFWSSIFTAKAIEKNYDRKQITVFGIGAGMSTLLFLGTTVFILTALNTVIPEKIVLGLNIVVALVMMTYGVLRLIRSLRDRTKQINSDKALNALDD